MTDVTCVLHGSRIQHPVPMTPFHQWIAPNGTAWTLFYRLGDSRYLLRFPELADFEVSADGLEVEGWAAPAIVSSATVEHLYLNQVLPLALSRQGKLVLHASAVEIGDAAVAFIAESGRGKSTLAGSFAKAGNRFLTDDGLQLEWSDSELLAIPSHPSIRLWEDSQDMLVSDTSTLAPPVDFTTKARFPAGPGFPYCGEAKPLRHVYFLGEGNAGSPTIEPLKSSSSTLIDLVRNSFLLDIAQQDMLARHFGEISRIATMPIYFRLDYPRRYEELPLVREAIIKHATERGH